MIDRPIIKPATIKSLIASGGTPEELIEAAYELGVTHGMRHKTEAARDSAAKKAKSEQNRRSAMAIAGLHAFKSKNEEKWWAQLCAVFKNVEFEPRVFPCVVHGKKTSYTPDFRVTTEAGEVFWVESKGSGWPFRLGNYKYRDTTLKQAPAIQACVRAHKLELYVVSGAPEDKYVTYQPLGLDITNYTSKETLVEVRERVIHLGKRPVPGRIAEPTVDDLWNVPMWCKTREEVESQGFPTPPVD